MTWRRSRRLLPVLLVALQVCGCQGGYVIQQGLHQWRLSRRKVPLTDIVGQPMLSKRASENLVWVPKILAFAHDELGIEAGDSYQTYLDTEGKPISYAVTAALPLALVPYQWRFPFAGRVSYKGFFELEDAKALEERLRQKGFDTLLTPVHAYSTLGWFRDPVLSTMLEKSLPDLVDLLIHESTHQTVYFTDLASETTAVNESLATHIAYEGTVLFLGSHPELHALLAEYVDTKAREAEIDVLLARLRAGLAALYASALSESEKLASKAQLFALASRAYGNLTAQGEAREFPVSNAFALAHAAYHQHIAAFRRLQEELGGKPRQLLAYLQTLRDDENPLGDK